MCSSYSRGSLQALEIIINCRQFRLLERLWRIRLLGVLLPVVVVSLHLLQCCRSVIDGCIQEIEQHIKSWIDLLRSLCFNKGGDIGRHQGLDESQLLLFGEVFSANIQVGSINPDEEIVFAILEQFFDGGPFQHCLAIGIHFGSVVAYNECDSSNNVEHLWCGCEALVEES